jgi:hypothetical protein
MSIMSQKIRRLRGIKTYLAELSILVGRPVAEEELGGLDEVAVIRNDARKFSEQLVPSFEVEFSARLTRRFTEFVGKLCQANPSPVYIWTPRTYDCGAFLIPSLNKINFAFDFSINPERILGFLTKDMVDRLVLDFELLPSGERSMTVKVQGENWIRVAY